MALLSARSPFCSPENDPFLLLESTLRSIEQILRESIAHEQLALGLYRRLLALVENQSIYLEEYARTQIGSEELHVIEMNKLLRDYTID